jgi:protection of telomeres protein 1
MKIRAAEALEASPSSAGTEPESRMPRTPAKPGDDLPPDSDDDAPPCQQNNKGISNPATLSERYPNIQSKLQPVDLGDKGKQAISKVTDLTISNKGFTCCIRQYGIKIPENSATRANAGHGLRWERVYGLFGTRIM